MFFTASRVAEAALEALPPAAALIVDPQMRVVDAEGSAFARHGLRIEETIGRPFTEALPVEARPAVVRHFKAALRGEPQSFDHWSADEGCGYWVRMARVEDEGSGPQVVAVLHDITGRGRAGERGRAVELAFFEQGFDAAPIGMVLTDPRTSRYLRVNDAMCELLGRSREELLGHSFEEFTHPEDRPADRDGRARMRRGETASHQVEKRYLRPDGTAVWTVLHVTPVRRPDGSLEAFFAQIVDIGARREREKRLEQDVAEATRLAQIRRALDEDGLLLHSQPIIDLSSGETVQNELLLRMAGEDGAVHLPGEFLPVAERYGLIAEIDRWVVSQAVRLAAAGTPTEFNLSGRSLDDPDILRELERGIAATGVDPSLLVVEVTETAVVDRFEEARRFAERIGGLGCTLALDDFGTGFANLSYLKHIPSQVLKIDSEFVRELSRSETDQRLVEGIVAFARAFGQKTVAEGVEDEATLARLKEIGVDMAQGHLLGRPRPLSGPAAGRCAGPTSETCGDAVDRVRSAFEAFARRDLATVESLCAEDVLIHPTGTIDLAGGRRPYRGHAGLRRYFAELETDWSALEVRPTTFVEAEDSVLVFGEVEGETPYTRLVADVLWVWRLRGESVSSVEAYRIHAKERR